MPKILIFILLFYFSLEQIYSSKQLINSNTSSNKTNNNAAKLYNTKISNTLEKDETSIKKETDSKERNFTEDDGSDTDDENTEKIDTTKPGNLTEDNDKSDSTFDESGNKMEVKNELETKFKEHYDDCSKDSDCKKGLKCKTYRCLTEFEINNLQTLNLGATNKCNSNTICPEGQQCIKHRCVDDASKIEIREKKKDSDTTLNLLFAGSIFLNNKAYESGEQDNDAFNYTHFFTHIKDDIQKADLAVVDQETIFQTNKTNFIKSVGNTPTELGDAIAMAGFKLVLHGTIYAYAKEEKGIIKTINFWNSKYPDIRILGISKTDIDSEDDYYIFEKKGIKIGIINFSSFINLIPEEKEYMVNVISEEKISKFVEKLKNKTDFIIVCMNWGDKNSDIPNPSQVIWARELTARGVDLIIGNHPSYVQPVSYIKSEGNKSLVFWSLGHLISDNIKNNTFLGALANICISKGESGKAFISDYSLTPIINHKVNTTDYSVYKLSEYTKELGLKMDKNFSMENVIKECENSMGPFVK